LWVTDKIALVKSSVPLGPIDEIVGFRAPTCYHAAFMGDQSLITIHRRRFVFRTRHADFFDFAEASPEPLSARL
jgi:hypothetical protein